MLRKKLISITHSSICISRLSTCQPNIARCGMEPSESSTLPSKLSLGETRTAMGTTCSRGALEHQPAAVVPSQRQVSGAKSVSFGAAQQDRGSGDRRPAPQRAPPVGTACQPTRSIHLHRPVVRNDHIFFQSVQCNKNETSAPPNGLATVIG